MNRGEKGWRLPKLAIPPSDDPRIMAISLGVLFVAAAALGALTLLLPHPDKFNDGALLGNTAIAFVAGLAIVAAAGRLPAWLLQVTVAIGTLLITRAIYYSDEPNAYYAFFYLWVTLYAFYFFGRFWGLVQMAVLGGAYAWVLTQISNSTPESRWLMTVVSLSICGVLLDVLARRMRQREAESATRARSLAAVDDVAHELSRRTTFESAAPAICDAALEVGDASGAALLQPTHDGGGLEVTAATDHRLIGTVVLLMGPPSGAIRAFSTRKPLFAPDAPTDSSVNKEIVEQFGVASVLYQPIMRDGTPIGVLIVYWAQPVPVLHEEVEQVVTLLAAEAAIAIERTELLARLERAARTDDLTGLPNRRAWDEYLGRELARAKRLQAKLCVAMLDLDHFKEYNDRHGHLAGDRLLKQAAGAWQEQIRETDLIARYGGEEFAIALLDCELEEASAMLDRLRLATPESESSSAGVAAWNGRESETELVARADAALYEAKRAGRNQVING